MEWKLEDFDRELVGQEMNEAMFVEILPNLFKRQKIRIHANRQTTIFGDDQKCQKDIKRLETRD